MKPLILRPRIPALAACAICLASVAAAEDRLSFAVGGSSSPFLGQREALGFAENVAATAGWDHRTDRFGFGLHLGAEDDGEGLRLDGTYAETYAGNWAFGIGAVDRHWSPSRFSSLILSGNARPFPSIYAEKREFTAFETPWLAWIGPWKAEVFLGQSDSEGNPDKTKLFGMRVQLQPLDGFEIDLVRTAQWGGDGLPENSDSFLDMLLGKSNEGPNAEANQLAGLGLSWQLPEAWAPVRLYAQAVGEDEAGGLPSCFMYLAGVEGKAQVFGTPTTVTLEGATTEISESGSGYCGPGTAYNNAFYPGGYTNHGDSMGLAIDTDSKMVQLIVEHELPQFDLHYSVAWHEINTADNPAHRLTSEATDGAVIRVGASRSYDQYRVAGEVWYQTYDLDKADLDKGPGIGLTVSRSF
ncbi:capsule assembly Wzi family protein [Cereibacter sp. SYSU M97828]|nr:capsule assembly Wzi family protein [Cereibacter flavus]